MADLVYPADLLGPGNDFSNIVRISLVGVEPGVIISEGSGASDLSGASIGDKKGAGSGPTTTTPPGGGNDASGNVKITATEETRNTHTTIWLPAPQVLNFTQAVNWGGGNLGGFNNLANRKFVDIVGDAWKNKMQGFGALGEMGDLVGDMFAGVVNDAASLGSQELANAIEYRTRSVRNPHAKVLFQGPNFRAFQLNFFLVPFEDKDSTTIKEIIRALSHSAAPGYANRFNGFLGSDNWFSWPDEVIIEIMLKNPETGQIIPNPYIQAIRTCVITDVTTTYGGQTVFAAHESGAPMDTQLSMAFMETEYVTKDRAAILYQGEK